MPKVTIIVEVEESTLTVTQGEKSCMFKREDSTLFVDHIVKLAESTPQVVAEPAETISMDAHRHPAPASEHDESLMDAVTGVLADQRVQQGVKSVWGFLQTLKTEPPPPAPTPEPKAEGDKKE